MRGALLLLLGTTTAAIAQPPYSLEEVDAMLGKMYGESTYRGSACRTQTGDTFIYLQVAERDRAEVFHYVDGNVVNVATFAIRPQELALIEVVSGGSGTIEEFEAIAEYLRSVEATEVASVQALDLNIARTCVSQD
jgi:hypothetical protein